MESIYYTDDYPIDGCTVKIESSDTNKGIFTLRIFAPISKGGAMLEIYRPMGIDEVILATSRLLKRERV